MTLEQILLTAFSGVLSFCGFILKLLWAKSEACEKWRSEKEPLINEMAERLGIAEAMTGIVNRCHVDACPFRGKLEASYSLKPNEKTHL